MGWGAGDGLGSRRWAGELAGLCFQRTRVIQGKFSLHASNYSKMIHNTEIPLKIMGRNWLYKDITRRG